MEEKSKRKTESNGLFCDEIPNMRSSTSMTFTFPPSFSSIFEMMPLPPPLSPTSSYDHPKARNFVGFMELLSHGTNHYSNPSSFDSPQNTVVISTTPPVSSVLDGGSEVLNTPTSPNSSLISSSSNEPITANKPTKNENEVDDEATIGKEEDHNQENTKKQLKPKKKHQKKQREPRFAFMTRSEVDHLDDGYRWRKYGQKAVKNSPHPRSYYRCTTTSCGVKKRVERSSEDPTVVVTTYEGQHTHPCPTTSRASLGFGSPSGLISPHQQFPDQNMQNPETMLYNSTASSSLPMTVVNPTSCINYAHTSTLSDYLQDQDNQQGFMSSNNKEMPLLLRNNGLLQDIVPMQMRNEDNKDHV